MGSLRFCAARLSLVELLRNRPGSCMCNCERLNRLDVEACWGCRVNAALREYDEALAADLAESKAKRLAARETVEQEESA